jgi:DNA-binding transcriptional ArsR family regulator
VSVVFRLPGDAQLQEYAQAGCSPLAEASFSLRALFNPLAGRKHPRWVRECRHLSPELTQDLKRHAPLFADAIPGFLAAATSSSQTIDGELQRVETTPVEILAAEVRAALDLWQHDHQAQLDSDARFRVSYAARARALTVEWCEDPTAARARLTRLLDHYWHTAFGREWIRLSPRLNQGVEAGARVITDRGSVAPGITLTDNAIIATTCPTHVEITVQSGNVVTLSPSAFLWPIVAAEWSEPWPHAIYYVAADDDAKNAARANAALLPALRALADPTRLAIVRLLQARPRTTSELAQLITMSDAAISQHLRQLRATSLVASHREGHYVVYSIDRTRIREVAIALATISNRE